MSFFLDNWYLFLAAAVSGAALLWPVIGKKGGASSVSPAEAVTLINREKAVLVDVSEPAEYAAGHALNARHVPFGELESSPKGLPTNKSLPVLLMCPTGARAGRAVGVLAKLGFQNVRSVAGGLSAWREAQLPVEKSAG
ncbi:rhodanese-like domain-containing protein [Rivibacter subsaxonicus]|uniref:rhodanese-like domain-containing protein n=1 Tax=Rivibacter subsaxonicus TaxID=457575 RepID=UPI00102CC465|nr:rhodanese-like domain-containing protein [Rivibacter subsaxonicus]